MKIERIQIESFGKLYGVDSGEEPLGDLVAVLGPNEAGKSTLFHFLTTVLYGFRPASRDSNPYAPWGGDDAHGSIRIQLDGGERLDVERRLRSQPVGSLATEGRTQDLRNRALPWMGHVPRSVFRQVFAVTLGELAGLDDETWGRIQDRILGSMGATDLRPARSVATELEGEAGALWKPHRRGNQRIRQIQEEIRDLRGRRRAAKERDREIRRIVVEQARTEARLAEAREERERSRVYVERVERMIPLRARLARIDSLRDEAGPPEALAEIPEDLDRVLHRARQRIQESRRAITEIDADSEDPRAIVASFDGRSRAWLDRRAAIESLLARSEGQSERHRAGILRREIGDREVRLERLAEEFLSVPWNQVSASALAALPIAGLRDRLRTLERAIDERHLFEASAYDAAPPQPGIDGRLAGGSAFLGFVLLVYGLVVGVTGLPYVGAALLAVGGTLFAMRWQAGKAAIVHEDSPDAAVTLKGREVAARTAFIDLLREIPVSTGRLEDPTDSLVTGLAQLREGVRDLSTRREELEGIRRRMSAFDREVEAIAASAGVTRTSDAASTVVALDRELREANRRKEAAEAAQRELGRLDRTRVRVLSELAEAERNVSDWTDRLSGLGDGDFDRGLAVAVARLQANQRAEQLEEELRRQHPDLADLRRRLAEMEDVSNDWIVTDDEVAARRIAIAALSDEIEALVGTTEALTRDVAHLRVQETVDSVDGQIGSLEEDATRLTRERDRRWLLAQVVRQADRLFREEHQPDLLRRAGRHLAHLTDGRYDRILVDETADHDLFQVMGPGLAAPIPLRAPVSTGTLEQAYLSLRLAIVDHLDQGGERLPLFIDEAFVNWDLQRRNRGVELLERVSRSRQLFFFTCHPDVASELTTRGAGLIRLKR